MKRNRKQGNSLSVLLILCLFLSASGALTAVRAEETAEPAEAETELPEEEAEGEEAEEDAEFSEELTEETPGELMDETGADALQGSAEADYTIMMYICGSDLEEKGAYATDNVTRILKNRFSGSGKIRFLVLLGGARKWGFGPETLINNDGTAISSVDPARVSFWEAFGSDAPQADKRSKLTFVKNYKESENANTAAPETLRDFISWGAEYAPAKKYGLILWDHGGGPLTGFAADANFGNSMPVNHIVQALQENRLYKEQGKKFEFLDFATCLMGGLEPVLAMADYTNCYIGSPEISLAEGQDYSWLNDLAEHTDMTGMEIGKKGVDLTMAYYNQPEHSAGITLTAVDTGKLVNSGMIQALTKMSRTMRQEAEKPQGSENEYLYYDELVLPYGTTRYDVKTYCNLRDFLERISIAGREITEESLKDDVIDDRNAYQLKDLLPVYHALADEDILYGRVTEKFPRTENYYRDANGDIRLRESDGSGLYLFFPLADDSYDLLNYARIMSDTAGIMPESAQKEFLKDYIQTAVDYALIIETGRYVNTMKFTEGTLPADLNYDSLKTYVVSKLGADAWKNSVEEILGFRDGGEAGAVNWLSGIISQQAKETISEDNTDSYDAVDKTGKGYRIVMKNTRKRVIADSEIRLAANLSAAAKYFEAHPDVKEKFRDISDIDALNVFTLKGELERITDPGKEGADGYSDYIRWLKEPFAVWNYAGFEPDVLAIRDADGYVHAAMTHHEGDLIEVPAVYCDGPRENLCASLLFQGNDDETASLKFIRLQEKDGPAFVFEPAMLEKGVSFEFTTVVEFRDAALNYFYIPITEKVIKVTAETTPSIRLEFRKYDEIPDISTEGKTGFTKNAVIKDIYGGTCNITKKVFEEPAGTVVNIGLADIRSETGVYTGKNTSPYLEYNGRKLTEGIDYYVLNGGREVKKPGRYSIRIVGQGGYYDVVDAAFEVVPASMNDTVISVSDAVYTGKAIEMKPVVKLQDVTMEEGTDYRLSWSDNLNAGTASVRIEGIGGLAGESRNTFRILPADLYNASIGGIADAAYTGKAIEPKPEVRFNDMILNEGTDYKLSYSNNVNVGNATVTVTGINNFSGSVTIAFSITESLKPAEVYRMYNPNSGEHFYTSAKEEKEALEKAGWTYEGVAFRSLNTSSHPLYRLYNPNAGDHHYTESVQERDYLIQAGWKNEGIAFYGADQNSGIPLYRLYNPNAKAGAHHYTASAEERDYLIAAGWTNEGIGFYGQK